MSLGELIASRGSTITEIAERMEVEKTQVMAWVCGEVPGVLFVLRLAGALGIPIKMVYAAILHTPKLI